MPTLKACIMTSLLKNGLVNVTLVVSNSLHLIRKIIIRPDFTIPAIFVQEDINEIKRMR